MQKSQPFSRFAALMRLATAMASAMSIPFSQALQAQGGYKSRGHGKGGFVTPTKRHTSKYMPHQGKREIARRAAKIGKFDPVYGATYFHNGNVKSCPVQTENQLLKIHPTA
jgi:hypothetical protein